MLRKATTPLFNSQRGFSLVELITVIVLIGILAVFVAPRFSGKDVFADYAAKDLIIGAARIAQQRAMYDHDTGACYRLNISGNTLSAQGYDGSTYNNIGPAEWQTGIALDAVVTVADNTIYFDALGNVVSSSGANCSGMQMPTSVAITINGTSNLQVCLYATGHFQSQVQGDACP